MLVSGMSPLPASREAREPVARRRPSFPAMTCAGRFGHPRSTGVHVRTPVASGRTARTRPPAVASRPAAAPHPAAVTQGAPAGS